MGDLVVFLHARLDELEAGARAIPYGDREWVASESGPQTTLHLGSDSVDFLDYDDAAPPRPVVRHIACHDPAAVLRDVAAKRAILKLHGDQHECAGGPDAYDFPYVGCATLRLLALPFAEHRDYWAAEWAP